MHVKKVFEQTHVDGQCAKQVVIIQNNGVVYTVVCDKSEYKSVFTPMQLRGYWNEGTDQDTGWGKHCKILVPMDHKGDQVDLLAKDAIGTLVDA